MFDCLAIFLDTRISVQEQLFGSLFFDIDRSCAVPDRENAIAVFVKCDGWTTGIDDVVILFASILFAEIHFFLTTLAIAHNHRKAGVWLAFASLARKAYDMLVVEIIM